MGSERNFTVWVGIRVWRKYRADRYVVTGLQNAIHGPQLA